MKKLEKLIKIPLIAFVLGVVFILIADWKDIEMSRQVTDIFMIIFFISVSLVLGIGLILSIRSIVKYIKKSPQGFLKSFILRFVILLVIDLGIDYINGKALDIGYGIAYSIALTIGSFYLEDKFLKE